MNSLFLIIPVLVIIGILVIVRPQPRRQLPYQQTYTFQNQTMSYDVKGDGPPAILLHGSMIADPWDDFEAKLAEAHTVYLPHLPGFGASDAIPSKRHHTDLFSESLCEFIAQNKLEKAPIISLSLGTVVSIKSAAKGCTQGKLILVGLPGKVEGQLTNIARKIPLWLQRFLVATKWGKEKILVPALYENTRNTQDKPTQKFLQLLNTTDPKSLVETDYKQEIENDLRQAWAKVPNEKVVIYGDSDAQKDSTKDLIDTYITIPNSKHNIFASQPEALLAILLSLLN